MSASKCFSIAGVTGVDSLAALKSSANVSYIMVNLILLMFGAFRNAATLLSSAWRSAKGRPVQLFKGHQSSAKKFTPAWLAWVMAVAAVAGSAGTSVAGLGPWGGIKFARSVPWARFCGNQR